MAEVNGIDQTESSVVLQSYGYVWDSSVALWIADPKTAVGGGGGSTIVTVSTGSVRVQQSSAADLAMTATPAAGSTWATRPLQSSAADLQMTATPAAGSTFNVRALNSSAADLQVTVTPAAGSTFNVRALQSSAADLNVTVAGYSTIGTVSTLQGRVLTDQNSTTWAVQARWVLPTLLSTGFSTIGNNSTSSTIVSSVAGQRVKVYAYSITSTHNGASANTLTFNSSAGSVLWPLVLRAMSSAVSGANLAVTPPGYLFATAAADPLVFKVTGSTGSYHLAFSYFQEA